MHSDTRKNNCQIKYGKNKLVQGIQEFDENLNSFLILKLSLQKFTDP